MQTVSQTPKVPTRFLDVLGEGVAIIDRSGSVRAANAALCGLLGVSVHDLVGSSVFTPPWQLATSTGAVLDPAQSPPVAALSGGNPTEATVLLHGAAGAHWVKLRTAALDPLGGDTDIAVVFEDLTQVIAARHDLHRALHTDPLTGLATRTRILAVVSDALDRAALQDRPRRVGLLHLDLDGFRLTNDSFGPAIGDAVLVEMADRLRATCAGSIGIRDAATTDVEIGRVGVDEFLVLVSSDEPGLSFDTHLRELADAIRHSIALPVHHDGLELHLTATVGAARGPDDATSAAELLAAADRAVRAGRQMGRNQFRFHDLAIDIRNHDDLRLDRDLRRATARSELEVYYQPIVHLRSGELAGAEALVRWHHSERGPVPPSEFIPTAEATGSIAAISEFVMTTVANDLNDWTASAILPKSTRVSVNISAGEFNRSDFLTRLAGVIATTRVDPRRLELEITESLLVDDLHTASQRIREIARLGMRVAIDDFGTGYSSLSYLHELPLHTLKVDRRFIGNFSDDRSGAITRTIVSLARNLDLVSVAEGVEHEHQRSFLSQVGCDLAQGFLFAPPLPRAAFERFLTDRYLIPGGRGVSEQLQLHNRSRLQERPAAVGWPRLISA